VSKDEALNGARGTAITGTSRSFEKVNAALREIDHRRMRISVSYASTIFRSVASVPMQQERERERKRESVCARVCVWIDACARECKRTCANHPLIRISLSNTCNRRARVHVHTHKHRLLISLYGPLFTPPPPSLYSLLLPRLQASELSAAE